MTINFTAPLRGAFHRPPAKDVLATLAIDTEVKLQREPDNPYDSNAVQVHVEPKNIPSSCHDSLRESLPGYGFNLDDVLAMETIMLGYVGKEYAERLAPALEALERQEQQQETHAHADMSDMIPTTADGGFPWHEAKLSFDMAGKPQITISFPEGGGT